MGLVELALILLLVALAFGVFTNRQFAVPGGVLGLILLILLVYLLVGAAD